MIQTLSIIQPGTNHTVKGLQAAADAAEAVALAEAGDGKLIPNDLVLSLFNDTPYLAGAVTTGAAFAAATAAIAKENGGNGNANANANAASNDTADAEGKGKNN